MQPTIIGKNILRNSATQGFIDYLETLQMVGISEIPLIVPEELRQRLEQLKKEQSILPKTLPQEQSEPPQSKTDFPDVQQNRENEMIKNFMKPVKPTDDISDTTVWGVDLHAENRAETLQLLSQKVCDCKKCAELAAKRTQTVFGVGNPFAELVFLGEAPGADEDAQGIPFVGRAGKLLTDMIEKGMRLQRNNVYICNILRCRPPGNRNPSPDEAARCRPFLDATLQAIRPKYICCLGTIAATNLLNSQETIGRMRGRIYNYQGIKVVCTYHPAYLLRNPSAKSAAWEDLQFLMREMGLPTPQKLIS
ncbi:MAG: uracil-DNA glycosylase [Planctomycetaceae bacterium]|jgi:DNA polymerase|nr:uracil-DNA glycosylase [Planctomycetaceae bacterium]